MQFRRKHERGVESKEEFGREEKEQEKSWLSGFQDVHLDVTMGGVDR